MTALLIRLCITACLILFISKQIKGIEVSSWWTSFWAAIVLSLINLLIYPIVSFLTLPFTIVTFGLFLFIVHAAMFKLCAYFVSGFKINGFVPALYGSILLTLLDLFISVFI